jgi:hypothetical protein
MITDEEAMVAMTTDERGKRRRTRHKRPWSKVTGTSMTTNAAKGDEHVTRGHGKR